MSNMCVKFKKVLAGILVGVSVLSAAVVPVVGNPVSVEAAVKTVKPVINLKSNTFRFGVKSEVYLSTLVKSIKKGTYNIKSVQLKVPSGVKITNRDSNAAFWSINRILLQKKGTYTVKVIVTDKKGNQVSKNVKIKVGNSISKYVTMGPTLTAKKGSDGNKIKFMSGIKYNKKYIDHVIPNVFVDIGYPTGKRGTYKIDYYVYAKSGEVLTLQRTLKIV